MVAALVQYPSPRPHFQLLALPGWPCLPPQVVESCKQYKELRSMGFKADIVVGALVLGKGDLAAATEVCITASMDT